MKTGFAMVVCIVWALPQFARAAPVDPPLTAAGLGGLTSAVEFCEKVDPKDKERLREKARQIMKALSEEQIEAMRRTTDFNTVHATIAGVLDGLPKDDAINLCTTASK
jgi:hypothetical protein